MYIQHIKIIYVKEGQLKFNTVKVKITEKRIEKN